jgi:hypothetical protein
MTTIEKAETDILAIVTKWSWLLLVVMTATCSIFGSTGFGLGVAAGGLIALGNNFWLRSILERILIQQRADARSYAIARYILRLTISGIIIVALMKFGINIAGLLVGLSTLVITITTVSVFLSLSDKGEKSS